MRWFKKNNNDHVWDGNRLVRQTCTSLESGVFGKLSWPPSEQIINITRNVLPFMVHLQIVQSGNVNAYFVPALSDWKEQEYESTLTEENSNYIKTGCSVQHIVVVVGWEKTGQDKKQVFIVISREQSFTKFLWEGGISSCYTSARLETMILNRWHMSGSWNP